MYMHAEPLRMKPQQRSAAHFRSANVLLFLRHGPSRKNLRGDWGVGVGKYAKARKRNNANGLVLVADVLLPPHKTTHECAATHADR